MANEQINRSNAIGWTIETRHRLLPIVNIYKCRISSETNREFVKGSGIWSCFPIDALLCLYRFATYLDNYVEFQSGMSRSASPVYNGSSGNENKEKKGTEIAICFFRKYIRIHNEHIYVHKDGKIIQDLTQRLVVVSSHLSFYLCILF